MIVGKDEAARTLEDLHAEVAALFARIPDGAFVQRDTIGGGEWSAKDLMAHLSDWEERAVEVLDAAARGERSAVEDALSAKGADALNAAGVRRWLDAPAEAVRARFERQHAECVTAISAADDRAWGAPVPYERPEPATLGELVGGVLGSDEGEFRHATAHLPDLRAYAEGFATNA